MDDYVLKSLPWDLNEIYDYIRQQSGDLLERFYNPKKLLMMKDRARSLPEIFISISNRGAGKTYGFGQFLLATYFLGYGRFGLLCRTQSELGHVAEGVLGKVVIDHYPEYSLVEHVMQKGTYSTIELLHKNEQGDIEAILIGYVLPLNASDKIKKISSTFVSITCMFFDEFQAVQYQPEETEKFVNIHFSVARGSEDGVRFVPVILASNSLTIENPYFTMFGIQNKIQANTHFYRGDGLVLERFVNFFVAEKQKQSAFNRACKNSKIIASNIDNAWLNDNYACVAKPTKDWGFSRYAATLKDGDKLYALRVFDDIGYWYIDRKVDANCKNIWALSVDGVENTPLLKTGNLFVNLRYKFLSGQVRFSDLSVKNIMYQILV